MSSAAPTQRRTPLFPSRVDLTILANAAITLPFFSYAETPQDFPDWFNWTPTLTGFSADPTNAVYRFRISGRMCFVKVRQGTAGTSNGVGFSVSAPIAALTLANAGWWGNPGFYVDNGVTKTGGAVGIGTGATAVTCYTADLGAWTASGSKRIAFLIGYEF